eukprot:TRINITY_DN37824_c0_g1_i1.p1 TRINITY_DN37824_c0_g1~~TRINITY_DN37824_c0_g1_i1.p1  ORF type:complete len:122 (-),score=6.85 TRINITY_DN37824_c0_g1_i1:100-465(-)
MTGAAQLGAFYRTLALAVQRTMVLAICARVCSALLPEINAVYALLHDVLASVDIEMSESELRAAFPWKKETASRVCRRELSMEWLIMHVQGVTKEFEQIALQVSAVWLNRYYAPRGNFRVH